MPRFTIYGYSLDKPCPFCEKAKTLLTSKGIDFEYFEVDKDPEKKEEMFTRNPRAKTVPQIFEGNILIGGSDQLTVYLN